MGRIAPFVGIAFLLGAAGAMALAVRNLLVALRPGGDAEERLVAVYNAPGILTNLLIAVALVVLGIGLMRSAQHGRVSRLVIGALGLALIVVMANRAGWL